jgi:hypothetical protein
MFATSIAARAGLLAALALAAAVTTSADARSAANKPNLVVTSSAPGSFTVTNTGTGTAAAFSVSVRGTFEYKTRHIIVNGLGPGASGTYSIKAKYCGGVAPTKDIQADEGYVITETSEGDNFRQVAEAEDCSGGA